MAAESLRSPGTTPWTPTRWEELYMMPGSRRSDFANFFDGRGFAIVPGDRPDDARRIAGDDAIGRDVPGHHAAGTHDRVLTDGDPRQNSGAGADRGSALDDGGF